MHLTHPDLPVKSTRYYLHSTVRTTRVLFQAIAFKVNSLRDHQACS
jgi:hypothetical protein